MRKLKILWLALLFATMAAIFFFSGQSGEASDKVSNQTAQLLNIEIPDETAEDSPGPVLAGFPLRKLAHVFLFALLGACSLGVFHGKVYGLLFCYAYALLDELHQSFVPGRTARITDTLIDAIGFLTVAAAFWCLRAIIRRKPTHREN